MMGCGIGTDWPRIIGEMDGGTPPAALLVVEAPEPAPPLAKVGNCAAGAPCRGEDK
jgi:hypothetical protein